MKEVADGKYGAEIPTTATLGGTVAYYIEAEDKEGGPMAARGSVDNPMVIHLWASASPRTTTMTTTMTTRRAKGRKSACSSGCSRDGHGLGDGHRRHQRRRHDQPVGAGACGAVQVSPEVGYWMDSSLMLSLQIRYQYITGTTDIYASGNNGVYHTANYALAGFAKATWNVSAAAKQVPPVLLAGGGRGAHPPRRQLQAADATNCGQTRTETCVDTIGAGPILVGPGGGLMYDIGDSASAVLQVNSVLGFPDFSVHFDVNIGVAFGF